MRKRAGGLRGDFHWVPPFDTSFGLLRDKHPEASVNINHSSISTTRSWDLIDVLLNVVRVGVD
jgi:hypothetical protein